MTKPGSDRYVICSQGYSLLFVWGKNISGKNVRGEYCTVVVPFSLKEALKLVTENNKVYELVPVRRKQVKNGKTSKQ